MPKKNQYLSDFPLSVCFFLCARKAHAVFQAEKFSLARFQAYPKKEKKKNKRRGNAGKIHRKRYKMMYLLYLLASLEKKKKKGKGIISGTAEKTMTTTATVAAAARMKYLMH